MEAGGWDSSGASGSLSHSGAAAEDSAAMRASSYRTTSLLRWRVLLVTRRSCEQWFDVSERTELDGRTAGTEARCRARASTSTRSFEQAVARDMLWNRCGQENGL